MKSLHTYIVLVLTIILLASAACLDDEEDENRPPVANAGPNQDVSMVAGVAEVHFTGSGSSDPDGDTLSYSWDFDDSDGDNDLDSDDKNPTYAYSFADTYTVTLRVSDGKLSHTDTMTVKVTKEPGNVEAVISTDDETKDVLHEGEKKTINFDGSDSTTKEGTIEEYEWDFNYTHASGFDVDATGRQVTHEFESGVWEVRLRVVNDTGSDAFDSMAVKMNYNMSYNDNIDSDDTVTYHFPLNSDKAYFLKVVLVYNNSEWDALDLDIYLYFPNGTEANNTSDVDDDHEEIRYDRGPEYGDRLQETGEWKVEIVNGQYSRSTDYYFYIDVVYFS